VDFTLELVFLSSLGGGALKGRRRTVLKFPSPPKADFIEGWTALLDGVEYFAT